MIRSRRMAGRAPGIAHLLAVAGAAALLLAACSSDPSPSGASASSSRQPSASASGGAPASFGPPPSPTPPDDATPIVLDSTLLGFLPASVGGTTITEDPDEAANALNDPGLPRIASAVDGAVAFDGGSNLVYAWVVQLRPRVFTAADFRQWRDAYDEGACAGAGGVVGRAEAQIGGRQAYVTSCTGGLHTYHVWLQAQDLLISASALGDARFGEKLLEGVRVPA